MLLTNVLGFIKEFIMTLFLFLKTGLEFVWENKEILFFTAGAIVGFKIGLFFGKDAAEEDVIDYLSGNMKIE